MNVPSIEGRFMRRREGGTGPAPANVVNITTSPGGARAASLQHDRLWEVRPPKPRKRENAAVARREGADARVMCVRVRRSGPARKTNSGRPAKSGQCAFSARHTPHLRGRKRDGQTPSPTKPGAAQARLFND